MSMTTATIDRAAADSVRWDALVRRDTSETGPFVVAVRTTGIYCRPNCPAKRPNRENVEFFDDRRGAERAGYRACKRCRPEVDDPTPAIERAVQAATRLLDEAESPVTLARLAETVGVSPGHLQRAFTRTVGLSPRAYGDSVRAERLRRALERGEDVTGAIYGAGFGSTSRVYSTGDRVVGMAPATFRKGGAGERVRYALADSSLGRVLVAATDRGVCAIDIADDDASLIAGLRKRFPLAERGGDDAEFAALVQTVVGLVERPASAVDLPLDLRGTAFQARVWQALRNIRPGETVTYAELAERVGRPTAVRAVANACGANRVVVAVPCHRVVASGGGLGGYRLGLDRKRALLAREAESA